MNFCTVTATARDTDRNTCPMHTNVIYLVKLINKLLKKEKTDMLPVSCWELATNIICANDFVTIDSLTWKYKCAMLECKSCPIFTSAPDPSFLENDVQYAQWKTMKMIIKKRHGEDTEKMSLGCILVYYTLKLCWAYSQKCCKDFLKKFFLSTLTGMHTTFCI